MKKIISAILALSMLLAVNNIVFANNSGFSSHRGAKKLSEAEEKKLLEEYEVFEKNLKRVVDVKTTKEYKIIINKKNWRGKDFAPGENPVAKEAFLKLKKDMQDLGFNVGNHYSGYRSYQRQANIYNGYVKKYGVAKTDTFSARPGHSEHQSGLAFDLTDKNGNLLGSGKNTEDAVKWLAENAHLYGFVVRYQKGKEDITGYMYEPWHIRFVGNDAAKIFFMDLTLEEFYNVAGGDYNKK